MKFSNGVVARIKFKTEHLGFKSTTTIFCSEDVYDVIEHQFGHEIGAESSSWTELASVGEEYEHDEFTIEMGEM